MFFSSQTVENQNEPTQSFKRLTQHYKERKAMSKVIDEIEAEMTFNHLPYRVRFFMFLFRIKYRILFLATIGVLFNYWGNVLGIASSRMERSFKKYKKSYIFHKHEVKMTYASANDTLYEPKLLSGPSTDRLSKLFV